MIAGCGPSGLLSAISSAQAGHTVTVLERMKKTSNKLRLTGKGRCNITNSACFDDFLLHFNDKARSFLKPSFEHFFSSDIINLLNALGIEIELERGGRYFPKCKDGASVIADKLSDYAKELGAEILINTRVSEVSIKDGKVNGVFVSKQEGNPFFIPCDHLIIATGGKSYKYTGSSGDGYKIAQQAGHTIVKPRPGLIPLITLEDKPEYLAGLTLKNIRATLIIDNQPLKSEFGEMLFTHFGLSGPVILTLSGFASDALIENKKVELSINLKPALSYDQIEKRLLRDFDEMASMNFENALKKLLPKSLIPVAIKDNNIDPSIHCSRISAKMRRTLIKWLMDFRFTIKGTRPVNEAIITQGGVSLDEVDPKTMESRLVKGLFFAGEVLDISADTGGFNLQAAFSTGHLAGLSV